MKTSETLKIIQPQEIEVWYVLPTIRKELALALKQQGLGQKQIAGLIGTTEAAVSQYVHNKRGTDIKVNAQLKQAFQESAQKISVDSSLLFAEIQHLIKRFWDEGVVCALHMEKCSMPTDCSICFAEEIQ